MLPSAYGQTKTELGLYLRIKMSSILISPRDPHPVVWLFAVQLRIHPRSQWTRVSQVGINQFTTSEFSIVPLATHYYPFQTAVTPR